ncbi:MAG TPA: NAD(P)-dependent oxidoreductase [Acidobacteriota bacterium]
MNSSIAFIGLGNMGLPMAGRLLKAGNHLRLHNRTRSRCRPLQQEGGTICESAAEAASNADIVITMLADDGALLETASGKSGFLATMKSGALHLDMSTVSATTSRRLAELQRERRAHFVAAPVFGRPEAAAAGKLWICAAGPRELEQCCRPLFEVLGRGYTWIGEDSGFSNVVKIAGNFMLLCMLESISEAFTLVEKHGIDPKIFFAVVSQLFNSPIYESYGNRMLAHDFNPPGFTLRLGLKDVNLMLQASQEVAAPLPVAALVKNHLLTSIARGREDWDLSSVFLVARENAGLK